MEQAKPLCKAVHLSEVKDQEGHISCLSSQRWVNGEERCQRWGRCRLPEKKTCAARTAEIAYHEHTAGELENELAAKRTTIENLKRGED